MAIFSSKAYALEDGQVLSQRPYRFPAFNKSGFKQTPEIKKYYETKIQSEFEAARKGTNVTAIKYSSDGLRVTGYVLEKKDKAIKPILIFNRGGNRDFGKIGVNTIIWLSRFAQKGFLVFASQYRKADEFGGKDVDDVLNLLKVARQWPHANSLNVFMLGHSRGGMESYLALKYDHRIRAAAILAGECSLEAGLMSRPDFEQVYEELIPDYKNRKAEELYKRSACSWPQDISAPIYILQGLDDQAVDPSQAFLMAERLQAVQKPFKLETFSGGHNLWFFDKFADEIVDKIDQWFKNFLKPYDTQNL